MKPLGCVATILGLAWGLAQGSSIWAASASPSPEREHLRVDFRYAPLWWQTSICLPDDWQKTLVGKEGTLLYDFPGRHSGFKTRLGVRVGEGEKWIRQELVSPRVPIVRTVKQFGDVEVVEEAFAVAPPVSAPAGKAPPPLVQRMDGGGGLKAWAKPAVACDPFFRDIAVGWNAAIHYRICLPYRQRVNLVLGFCESWHSEPGRRILEVRIEGKSRARLDLVAKPGRNIPFLLPLEAADTNGDGAVDVEVVAAPGSTDQNAILNVLWVFEGSLPPPEELMAGKSSVKASAHVNCGEEPAGLGPPRHDVCLVHLVNRGREAVSLEPSLVIDSEVSAHADPAGRWVTLGQATTVFCPEGCHVLAERPGQMVLGLGSLELKPGQTRGLAIGVLRGVARPDSELLLPRSAEHARQLRQQAEAFWEHADLPYFRLEVPDAGVQALLDGAIRNIYQAREIKKGLPAFQVGPTCYRGLWVVDGSFLMESVAFLGRTEEARNGIHYLLGFQRPDGAIMLINGHWKETGIALWAVTRHARLTGDKAWLAGVWPQIERAWQYIGQLRREASKDPKALNYGLIPEGFSDGGLGETLPEYTNIYWTLAGMKAAVEAAHWLGRQDQAHTWRAEYEDFYATFRKAAARDTRTDPHGNRYLPISMKPETKVSPQKAQWAFLHAVFPGKVFAHDDPLVQGNLAMLRAAECEGLVRDTGWVAQGVWNYFGSFYAHAWLWQHDGSKAARTLYAMANHASPLLCWREEQMPQGEGPAVCGDMPHNWASAEFIRLVRHLLILERGDELHLAEGVPPSWIVPGKRIRAAGVLTEFGPVTFEVRVAPDGTKATVALEPPRRNPPRRIVLHLDGWSGGQGLVELPTDVPCQREVPLVLRP